MTPIQKAFAALLIAAMVPVLPVRSEQAQVVTGTRTGAAAVRLAAPEFVARTGAGEAERLTRVFNETLWQDLEFSGIVTLVSRSFYPLGSFGQPIDIDTAAWTSGDVDAQFLAFGNTSVRDGRFFVEARLWDLKTRIEDREAVLPGRRFGGEPSERAVRLIAHQWADAIIRALGGGIRGVSQTKIAFVSDRTSRAASASEKEIWVMDYDGHNQYQLTTLGSLALTPAWAPDGERIAYTSYRRDTADVAIISPLDRRGFRFPDLEGTTTTPSWAPDGSRIAFASSHERLRGLPDVEIYIADADGGNMRRLTTSRGVDISPTWNPGTGRQIAFSSDRTGSPQIWIIDADGGNLRQIVEGGGAAVNPAWSPDGRTIAFAWQRPRSPGFDIYIHDITSGRNVQLTQNSRDNERPTWSPDGRHIAFQSNRNGTTQIYTMLADGTRVRQLTSQGKNEGPAWSHYMGQ